MTGDAVVVLTTGLALGVTYGLLGASVSLIWMTTRSLFLAAGPVLVAGVLVRLFLSIDVLVDLPGIVPIGAGIATAAGLSAALAPLVFRPLREDLVRLVGLAVAGLVIETGILRLLGARTYRPQPIVELFGDVTVGGVTVGQATLLALLVGLPLVGLLAVGADRTRLGRAARLVGGSEDAAMLVGVSPGATRTKVLAVAGAAIALAGFLVAPVATVGATQGAAFTLRAVAAAALFGVAGPRRALLAGVTLGLVEALAQQAMPSLPGDVAVGATAVLALVVAGDPSRRRGGRAW